MDGRLLAQGQGERGSSLAEVLVALFLIAIALLAAAPMFVLSTKENSVGADTGRVGSRANARMELLRTTPYYDLQPGGGLNSNITGFFDTSDPDVVVRWEIVDGGGPTGTRTVAVRALATRQVIGRPSSVVLRTLRVR